MEKCYKTIGQMGPLYQVMATEEARATVAIVVDAMKTSGRSNNWSKKYESLDTKHLNKWPNMWILSLEEAIQMQYPQSAKWLIMKDLL